MPLLPAWLPHIGPRRLRLVSGLVLFTYVATHLDCHALANISLAATDWAFWFHGVVWADRPGQLILYAALATHLLLGIWALYHRPRLGWTAGEALQVTLGLSIPLMLATHMIDTRGAAWMFGTVKGYPEVLQVMWIARPSLGVIQALAVPVAWVHGCLGLYFWLRLRPFFTRWSPVLLAAATVLPVLALLGYFQGGQAVMERMQDPAWRAAHPLPSAAIGAQLDAVRDRTLLVFAGLVALALLARALRRLRELRGASVRIHYPGRSIRVPRGTSVLEASLIAGIGHAHVCGGRGRCSTCRIRVEPPATPPPDAPERAVLSRVRAEPDVRLACQFRPARDVTVVPMLSPHVSVQDLRQRGLAQRGEERFIVVMVVDMRNSTAMAEARMPFDAVFVIDRFVDAVGRAIQEAGGRPNQFTGDGVFALFGLACDPQEACRQAIRALAAIGRNVAALGERLGFGVGIHCGTAVVGEIGFGGGRLFTALGDPANVASRLESLCKKYSCEAVISNEVCSRSGLDLAALPSETAELAGRVGRLDVRLVARAAEMG